MWSIINLVNTQDTDREAIVALAIENQACIKCQLAQDFDDFLEEFDFVDWADNFKNKSGEFGDFDIMACDWGEEMREEFRDAAWYRAILSLQSQ